MAVAVVHSRALAGVEAPVVTVEVHLANGLPGVHLVGLPETEVREARDRVRAALQNAQFEFPARKVHIQCLNNRPSVEHPLVRSYSYVRVSSAFVAGADRRWSSRDVRRWCRSRR